jgi:hypothetical protein
MCKWEQDCSDNPLLFDPDFARCYISERCSWFINKQSTCAKCKLKLGEHLLDHQQTKLTLTVTAIFINNTIITKVIKQTISVTKTNSMNCPPKI